ncbi:MAG: tetratricopeptide repeat protein [Crocinitomicaceae bacterium]|nr:tetratricopeptide repeat protein [Crocinitomicaceae bacterium]
MNPKHSLIGRLFILVAFLLNIFTAYANSPDSLFNHGNELFQQQHYAEAAGLFEKLIEQEYRLPEVYYNLGNCYFKNDKLALAILNFERARKLAPGDEDIAFNLRLSQLKTVDNIEALPLPFYKRWANRLNGFFSVDGWSALLLLCVWITFGWLGVFLLSTSVVRRKGGLILSFAFLVLGLFCWWMSSKSYRLNFTDRRGVVLPASIYVKSAPGENNTDLLMLHEGAGLDILDEYDGWMKIRISNGSEGWINAGAVAVV